MALPAKQAAQIAANRQEACAALGRAEYLFFHCVQIRAEAAEAPDEDDASDASDLHTMRGRLRGLLGLPDEPTDY